MVLEHHSNLAGELDTWQNRLLQEDWDAPVVMTTAVQFLNTVFSDKLSSIRRLHSLANCVIILDELQRIPVRASCLVAEALNTLSRLGATVVLATATPPPLHVLPAHIGALIPPEKELAGSIIPAAFDRVSVVDRTVPGGWATASIAELLHRKMEETGSSLAVVNTRDSALQLYNACKEDDNNSSNIYHLSTSMCAQHRLDVIHEMKERLKEPQPNVICCSTQLIEAGVDIDFGFGLRYLAGLDSIAQTAGRVNRNRNREHSEVYVINPRDESLRGLDEIYAAKCNTRDILYRFRSNPNKYSNNIIGKEALGEYFRAVYSDTQKLLYPLADGYSLVDLLSINDIGSSRLIQNNGFPSNYAIRAAFRTGCGRFQAIADTNTGIVVPYGHGEELISKLRGFDGPDECMDLIREAHRYVAQVTTKHLEKLQAKGVVHYFWEDCSLMFLADARYYDSDVGLIFGGD